MTEAEWVPPGPILRNEAQRSHFEAGVRFAMSMVASRIRDELVCCTEEDIAEVRAAWERKEKPKQYHAICYWGEMSARLAEDPHSLLVSPYECEGEHPGRCGWSLKRCQREKHVICQRCMGCTVDGCDDDDDVCRMDGTCTPIGRM